MANPVCRVCAAGRNAVPASHSKSCGNAGANRWAGNSSRSLGARRLARRAPCKLEPRYGGRMMFDMIVACVIALPFLIAFIVSLVFAD